MCQPGGGASCGACCGLYNFKDHSRAAVTNELRRHTRLIARTPRTAEAYADAAAQLKREQPSPAFSDVRVCPLLGFLDGEREETVGCLAHPKHTGTGGIDLRDCGVYRAEICESFECPSHLWLSPDEARLIAEVCRGDWYLYGLVITDVDFVRAVFRLLARSLGEDVPARRLLEHPDPRVREATGRVFALREGPGDRQERGVIFGRFAPPSEAGGEPVLRTLDYERLGARAAPEDELVLLCGLAPETEAALEVSRAEIRSAIASLAEALVQTPARLPAK